VVECTGQCPRKSSQLLGCCIVDTGLPTFQSVFRNIILKCMFSCSNDTNSSKIYRCLVAENTPRLFYAQPANVTIFISYMLEFNAYTDSERLRQFKHKLYRIRTLSIHRFNQHFWKPFALIETILRLNVNYNLSGDDDGAESAHHSSEYFVLKSLTIEGEN
jgi:hypothetical protein